MAEPLHNLPELTVSEISQAVKRTLEATFERVRVRGEVSKPNYHGSGHLYFSLKDEGAVIDAVCWKGVVGRLKLKLEHGMEIIVTGRVSSYPGSSKYQIVIESVELAGEGALLKMLEERKKRLAAEGLFDESRKRPLPYLPDVIGVITSPTGAVIRDILHRLADRFPRRVLLWPVAVQGEGAAAQVAAAIRGFNALTPGGRIPRPDLLIVARGGGSLEDLMPFNEEEVVRAAAASAIPLIAAVGHETDVTLIDFAADRRAPTPTAAAEMAVPVRAELFDDLADHGRRLVRSLTRLAEEMTQRLDGWIERLLNARRSYFASRREHIARLAAGLPTPKQQLAQAKLKLDHAVATWRQSILTLFTRKQHAFERASSQLRRETVADRLERARLKLESLSGLLDSYSYERVLARGFALVRDAAGHPLGAAAAVAPGSRLHIQFTDGEVAATADGEKAKPLRSAKPSNGKQGSLL